MARAEWASVVSLCSVVVCTKQNAMILQRELAQQTRKPCSLEVVAEVVSPIARVEVT